MLLGVVVTGVLGSLFTVREWGLLYAAGTWLYLCLVPVVEATEQTVTQRVVPLERQGRVFGFAMALEWASAPVTAFLIAPIAEFWIIPWARSDEGTAALAPILGTGAARGIALVFLVAGVVMVLVALAAFRSGAYRAISRTYRETAPALDDSRDAEVGDPQRPGGVRSIASTSSGWPVRCGPRREGTS